MNISQMKLLNRFERLNGLGQTALALAPIAFTLIGLAMISTNRSYYNWVIREDGPVEWLTVVVYGLAAIIAFTVVMTLRSAHQPVLSVLFALFALGLVFVAGEEASWGQRIFGYETPESWASVNTKDETNIHNLSFFPVQKAFLCVALYGAFGRILLGPVFARIGPIWRDLLTAPPVLFFYFVLPAGLFVYFEYVGSTVDLPEGMRLGDYLGTKFITGKEQEPMELLLGSAFLLFSVYAALRARDHARDLEGPHHHHA